MSELDGIRRRAAESIVWAPGTEASDPAVYDRLWAAVRDRETLLAMFDRDLLRMIEIAEADRDNEI